MNIEDLHYTFRHSRRAKSISLRLHPQTGLEIVLPPRCPQSAGLAFLKQQHAWIKKHAHLIQQASQEQTALKQYIHLHFLNKTVQICYRIDSTQRIRLRQTLDDMLVLSGNIKSAHCCQPLLNTWLKRMGEQHLLPFLHMLSQATQLHYRSASIRLQRTRWGSCSAQGDISLNAYLLHHPKDIVRYVLIHELCHLKEMNHSARFWKLVESFVPTYRNLKQKLQATPSDP